MENKVKELSKYERLFQEILKEISEIDSKVQGTLSYGSESLMKACEQTPSQSPLERDYKIILERLVGLKNSIN